MIYETFAQRLVLEKRLYFVLSSQDELITCTQRIISRVLTIFYLDHLQFGNTFVLLENTYHQYKDKNHVLIMIEESG